MDTPKLKPKDSVVKLPLPGIIEVITLKGSMTPEQITGKLFSFHNTAHFYHFQTNSHATHKALEHLYEHLVHLKDEIPEFLLGCQLPKRFEYIMLDDIKPYNDTNLLNFLEEGCKFGCDLADFAEINGWDALEDMAGKVEKVFNHTKLLISYK